MQIKKYNITKSVRKYQNKFGEEKTQWANVGTMTEFHKDDGTINRIIEIPAIGLEASVFEQKPRDSQWEGHEHDIDAETGAKRPITQNKASQGMPAVIAKPENRTSDDQINYPTETINPDDIPF